MILDIIILVVLIVSAVIAFFRGFIKEVLTIVGLGGAAFGAFLFGGMAVPFFEGFILNPNDEDYKFFDVVPDDIVALLAAYAAVFLVIFLILTVIGHYLSKGAAAIGLGPVDRSLGVIFGLLRGVVLVAVLYLPFSLIMTQDEMPDFVQESKLVPLIDDSVNWTIETAGIERPLEGQEDDTDEEEDTADDTDIKGKLTDEMINKVREEYIGNSPPAQDKEKDKGEGYQDGERDALEDLIEGETDGQ